MSDQEGGYEQEPVPEPPAQPPKNIQINEEFRNWVKEWIEWDDTESNAKRELTVLRKHKKGLTEKIMGYMTINGIENINITGGKIEKKTTSRMLPVNKEYLAEALASSGLLKTGTDATDVAEHIYNKENRPRVEKDEIKRKIIK